MTLPSRVSIPGWALVAAGLLATLVGAGWTARGKLEGIERRVASLEADTTAQARVPRGLDSLRWEMGRMKEDIQAIREGVTRIEAQIP